MSLGCELTLVLIASEANYDLIATEATTFEAVLTIEVLTLQFYDIK
jgi:hypothetical protein